jgi:hypothetical protein
MNQFTCGAGKRKWVILIFDEGRVRNKSLLLLFFRKEGLS